MKELSKEQMNFLAIELGLLQINYSDMEFLEDIRMKCFDIETEETVKCLKNEKDEVSIGERGDMAVSIIDDLYEIMSA